MTVLIGRRRGFSLKYRNKSLIVSCTDVCLIYKGIVEQVYEKKKGSELSKKGFHEKEYT